MENNNENLVLFVKAIKETSKDYNRIIEENQILKDELNKLKEERSKCFTVSRKPLDENAVNKLNENVLETNV